jgi:hypothetical protein
MYPFLMLSLICIGIRISKPCMGWTEGIDMRIYRFILHTVLDSTLAYFYGNPRMVRSPKKVGLIEVSALVWPFGGCCEGREEGDGVDSLSDVAMQCQGNAYRYFIGLISCTVM